MNRLCAGTNRKATYLSLQSIREGFASHTHVLEIVRGLRRRGWAVNLFAPGYTDRTSEPSAVQRLCEFTRVQASLVLKGLVQADILYVRFHFAAFPIALLGKILRKPVVQELNGPYDDLFIAWPWTRRFAPLFESLMRWQLLWADGIVVVTPQLKDWLLNQIVGEKLVCVIPNGADTAQFNPHATTKRELPEHYVTFHGSMSAWQGIDTLLAATESRAWPETVHLVIMGGGSEQREVQQHAARNRRIWYLGCIPYAEVPGVVAGGLAGLCPKNDRGNRAATGLSPVKLYETLACAVPAVVTGFPGQADIIRQHKCGIVIPHSDPDALAEAVAYLHKHPAERMAMGKRGREAINREHSWHERAARTDVFLCQVSR